jgi:hypothetical protein
MASKFELEELLRPPAFEKQAERFVVGATRIANAYMESHPGIRVSIINVTKLVGECGEDLLSGIKDEEMRHRLIREVTDEYQRQSANKNDVIVRVTGEDQEWPVRLCDDEIYCLAVKAQGNCMEKHETEKGKELSIFCRYSFGSSETEG